MEIECIANCIELIMYEDDLMGISSSERHVFHLFNKQVKHKGY